MRSQARHDQIRRQIEHHVAYIEQRQARGDLVRRCAQHGAQVVARVFVHGLREPDVRADRGAQEVEDPEGRDYAVIEFSGLVSLVFLFFWVGEGDWVCAGLGAGWRRTGRPARCWRRRALGQIRHCQGWE